MTKPLRKAIEIIARNLPKPTRILEIGSRQEKNQQEIANLRELFPGSRYLGTDMRPGPGVDRVADAEKLPFEKGAFDLVLCLETLEHARKPWLIAGEIERVVSSKGIAIVSSQQNFPIHKHPSDYFRYTPFGMTSLFDGFASKLVFSISPPFDNEVKLNPQAVILVASKKKNDPILRRIKSALKAGVSEISGHKPYRHRLFDMLKIIRRGLAEANFRQEIEFF